MAIHQMTEILAATEKEKLAELVNEALSRGIQYGSSAIRLYRLAESDNFQVYLDSPSIL